ncbi:hypothetical protein OIDMADRAFT_51496 [Oidiodendron maius Zn]|uniref:Kinesin light chain n=1 Tax=Oidiodendron maius (strain Zn) TaxID=913774 RepID=A0A0C3H5S3_OIDMZ|nr:hypothetical protein OIDMADRAFT_51496 [Oidiodendron maius Zn]
MANLASTYRNQGRWKEAEELQVQVIEMRKRALGAEHPDTITIMANLASTYINQGRWKEAEKLSMQNVCIYELRFWHQLTPTVVSSAELTRLKNDKLGISALEVME